MRAAGRVGGEQRRGNVRRKRGRRHPGVTLLRPNEAKGMWWRAQYVDPDRKYRDPSKRGRVYETLPRELTTLEQREEWAARKSRDLARRRVELDGGASRATGTALKDAVARYFAANPQLRKRTEEGYREAADKLIAWCEGARVRTADDLTRAKLMAFREALVREPKRTARKGRGAGRGSKVAMGGRRSPERVNTELRRVHTVLAYLRRAELLPRLSSDALRDALRRTKVSREAPVFLRPRELVQLLEAALRHDTATFAETRAEHAGRAPVGSTPRYEPIAPFVATVLLGGFRLAEALELRWSDVDLSTVDAHGNPAGEIRLGAHATKTAHARVVGLDVCPSLRRLLAALRLGQGRATYVFGGLGAMSRALAEAARKRLVGIYGAPEFSWQVLRSTCATYSCNAPSLWGAASAFVSAKRLGHSVQVAERRYAGQVTVPHDARSLEAAMQVEDVMGRLSARVSGRFSLDLRSSVDRL